MRVFVAAIFCLVLASAAVVQITASQADRTGGKHPGKQPAVCSVAGQVISATDGAPLISSRVVLIPEDSDSPQAFSAATDSDGRFEIKNASPGSYTFLAIHTGYISQQYQARGPNGGALLTLVPGQELDRVLFRLVRGAVITGRILDENGEPMARVSVAALRRPNFDDFDDEGPGSGAPPAREELISASAAITDDRGEYRMFGLNAGEYYVKATATDPDDLEQDGLGWIAQNSMGSHYASIFYPGVLQFDQAQPVVLAAGEELRTEFAMRQVKTMEVSGRVIAADGGAARGALVSLFSLEGTSFNEQLMAICGTKGEFTIRGVPQGRYVLNAQQRGDDGRQFARQ